MLEVDKNTFQAEVLEAEGYVFVDFFGDGCVPCQALMPFVHSMADRQGGTNQSDRPLSCRAYRVRPAYKWGF